MGSSDTVVLMPTSDPSPSTGKATAVAAGRKGQESGSRESASAAKASSSSSSGSRETAAVKADAKKPVAIASPMKPGELARKKKEEATAAEASADGTSKNGKKKSKWVFHLGKHKRATGKADEEEVKEETPAGPVDELDEPMSVAERTEKLRLLLDTSPHDLKVRRRGRPRMEAGLGGCVQELDPRVPPPVWQRVYVKSEPLAQWRLEVLCDMQLQGPADEPAKHQRQSSEG